MASLESPSVAHALVATAPPGAATGSLRRETALRVAALAAAVITIACGVVVLWFVVALPVEGDADRSGRAATAPFVTGMAALAVAGAILLRQQPRSVIGWLLVQTGLAGAASRASLGLALALDGDSAWRATGWADAAGWLTNWSWVPAQALALLLFLRFPHGSLPSRRWRFAEAAVLGWAVLTVLATALLPGELGATALAPRTNPLGVGVLAGVLDPLLGILFAVAPLLVVVAVAAPASRWRRADPQERRQLRVVGAALLLVAACAPLALVSDTAAVLEGVAYLVLPVALAWSVLRHRLWDVELRRRFDRLRAVRQEERARLQRELHDTLGPLLGSIAMRAEAARNLLAQGAAADVDDVLDGIGKDTESAVIDVRRIIDELGPSALADSDLPTALRVLVERYAGAGPRIELDLPADLPGLDPTHEIVAYRVVTEGVRNVVRHAAARHCLVRVAVSGRTLTVSVADDGVGLQGHPPGVGRRTMADRVAEVGGELTVMEPPTGGVAVQAVLPGAVR